MSELNQPNNIRQIRMMLNMTQKDFLRQFLIDDEGKTIISPATLSNLELKGGERLDEVISILSKRFSLSPETFSLEAQKFNEKCSETLENFVCTFEKKNCKVKNILNSLTMYFADEIMEGRLKRGEKIPSDRELAKNLGVGRSTVREALKVLDFLGMIDIRPGQGTYLANSETNFFAIPLSWSLFLDGGQVKSIITIRSILETKSAELAAQCTDEILLSKLDKVFHQMHSTYQIKDYEKFLDDDIEFHSCIAECSKNQIIYSMLQTIRNFLRRISKTGMIDEKQMSDIYTEHRKIYGAIISHNAEYSMKYMLEHVEHASERYVID